MAEVNGAGLLVQALKSMGVDTVFYLPGGPMRDVVRGLVKQDVRLIDVRHEQAAAMMAHAYSRVTGKPGVCMTGAGPDALNLITGLSNALVDCCPVVAVCGSASLRVRGMGAFQEVDQLDAIKPVTKRAWLVPTPERVPAFVDLAFRHAVVNQPGPVYLELPSNVLQSVVEEGDAEALPAPVTRERPMADEQSVARAIDILATAQRPIVLAGSGVFWSEAAAELQQFVDATGIPFYTTPLARGLIPEDHPLCFPGARSVAWREADCLLVIGTRANFIVQHLRPPRFSPEAQLIEVNVDAEEIGHNRRPDLGIVGDAKAVLRQFLAQAVCRFKGDRFAAWVGRLQKAEAERQAKVAPVLHSEQKPIHPLRLCKELMALLPRDAILAVDGQEILNFARQTIPTYYPGHRLNPGPSGCIGVGVPFGVAAKVARPEKTVVVLTGDGSFGMNGMEIDTAVRHKLPIVVVISNNGGWGGARRNPRAIGRYLGFPRYDKMAEGLGAWAEYVEEPGDIRPALERAFSAGQPAVVNVITDPVMAVTQDFGDLM